jgi:hypothetical protein
MSKLIPFLVTALMIGALALFTAAIGWSTSRSEEKSLDEITPATTLMVVAIESNKPSAAPEGAADYVRGVREYFGRISGVRSLGSYTKRGGTGSTATTDAVSEILVRGTRGAGVVELLFEGSKITGMSEVKPDDVHGDLSAVEKRAVERGFARRGGKPANITILSGAFRLDGTIR